MFLASDNDSIESEVIKHFWYFESILEHIVFDLSPSNEAHFCVSLLCSEKLECLVVCDPQLFDVQYDAQFFPQ